MKTIIVANQKGGIGKTTTATAVASILNAKGYKTLLIVRTNRETVLILTKLP